MAKYVSKAANLRKQSSQESSPLSPYSQNPHTPDYSNVSKISTTPEPTSRSQATVSSSNHPLAQPPKPSTTSSSSSTGASTSNANSPPFSNTDPSISPNKPPTNTHTSTSTSTGSTMKQRPTIPLPRPHRTSSTTSRSQNFPKSPAKPNTNRNSSLSSASSTSSGSSGYYYERKTDGNKSGTSSAISHPLSNTNTHSHSHAHANTSGSMSRNVRGYSGHSHSRNVQGSSSNKGGGGSQLNLPQLGKNMKNQNMSGNNPFRRRNISGRLNSNSSSGSGNNINNNNQQVIKQGRSIFDVSLNANRTKVVSLSAFSYLFCELVNYCQKGIINIAQLEERLSDIGYYVGTRQLELVIYRNKPGKRETDRIGILEFIQKTVWKRLFQKQADGLEQSMQNKNEFFIIDNTPITNRFVSVPADLGDFNCASFIGGIIHGILENAGFACKVITHEAPMDDSNNNSNTATNEFNSNVTITKLEQKRTVFIIQFEDK